jgi:5-methylcytosine-specific restriction endonuclease McrA
MGPSLDHIVPVSLGGTHTWANVQLAHLRCNVSKGNRPANEQLRLVG